MIQYCLTLPRSNGRKNASPAEQQPSTTKLTTNHDNKHKKVTQITMQCSVTPACTLYQYHDYYYYYYDDGDDYNCCNNYDYDSYNDYYYNYCYYDYYDNYDYDHDYYYNDYNNYYYNSHEVSMT